MPPTVAERKAAVRAAMREVRRRIAEDPAERARRSSAIWAGIVPLLDLGGIRPTCRDDSRPDRGARAMVFASLPTEPDTSAWTSHLTAMGFDVFTPEVDGPDLRVVPGDVDPATLDVVLVPGLAFTADGVRLGQGGGHFDRFLPRLRPDCLTIGVGYREQLVDDLPDGATRHPDDRGGDRVTDRLVEFRRRSPSLLRLGATAMLGAVAGVLAALFASWQLSLLLGWIIAALTFLGFVWRVILQCDGPRTRLLSLVEDDTRAIAGIIIVLASTASLVCAGLGLHKADRADGPEAVQLTIASVALVGVSWLVVNTEYALRYAHRYYLPPEGGIEFAGTEEPDYRDFAYLAFTIGMTYQVSDTPLKTPELRRLLLTHALTAYVFGVVIVAAVINIVAGIVS